MTQAATLCDAGEPLSRAKALYRRAVARLKQGSLETAKADLRAAHGLRPGDREVT